jgi:DnaA family protein
MKSQLPFSFHPPEYYSFTNFFSGRNHQLIYSLNSAEEKLVYLWGEKNTGKTHLLQALMRQQQQQGKSAIYLPLSAMEDVTPEIFQGLENMQLICLDDLHAVIGQTAWEEPIFHLFNRVKESGSKLILAANNSAVNLKMDLADLKSRLSWGLTYHLYPLDDKEKIAVLKLRAEQRGFELSNDVAVYLINRATRDLSELVALLEQLDYATLAQQRKLTVPFIKKFL